MSSRRTAKVAEAIREQVSLSILFEMRDPRVKNVTVIRAEVSGDLRAAKVYYSVRGDEKAESLCQHGLDSARGFLQSKVADRLQTRYTPILTFVLDRGVKKSLEAARILREVLPPTPASESESDMESAAEVDAELEDSLEKPSPEIDDETEREANGDGAVPREGVEKSEGSSSVP